MGAELGLNQAVAVSPSFVIEPQLSKGRLLLAVSIYQRPIQTQFESFAFKTVGISSERSSGAQIRKVQGKGQIFQAVRYVNARVTEPQEAVKKPRDTKFCCRGFKGEGKTWQDERPQCEDCPMKAWDLNYEDAVEFANGILADAAKHKDYRPSGPAERLINMAKAFLKPLDSA